MTSRWFTAIFSRSNQVVRKLELRAELPGWPEWVASYGFQETRDSQTNQFLDDSPRSLAKLNVTEKLPKTNMVTSIDAQYRSRMRSAPGRVPISHPSHLLKRNDIRIASSAGMAIYQQASTTCWTSVIPILHQAQTCNSQSLKTDEIFRCR